LNHKEKEEQAKTLELFYRFKNWINRKRENAGATHREIIIAHQLKYRRVLKTLR
jgi:hypothetical protein